MTFSLVKLSVKQCLAKKIDGTIGKESTYSAWLNDLKLANK